LQVVHGRASGVLPLRQPFPLSNYPFDLEAAKDDPQVFPLKPQRSSFDSLGNDWFEIRQFQNFFDSGRRQHLPTRDVGNLLSQCPVAAGVDKLQWSICLNRKAGRRRFAGAVFLQVRDGWSDRLNPVLARRQRTNFCQILARNFGQRLQRNGAFVVFRDNANLQIVRHNGDAF
jgi:hypothetical protein